ncbi:MAG TPA: tetratricopeptide repeat protein, partial [Candidatus Obscuribacterales bacterium]
LEKTRGPSRVALTEVKKTLEVIETRRHPRPESSETGDGEVKASQLCKTVKSGSYNAVVPESRAKEEQEQKVRGKDVDTAIKEAEVDLKLLKQMVGDNHPSVADSLTKLADLYCRKRMYRQMEPLLVEALQIREGLCGSEHVAVSTELKNLGRLYYALGQYSQAESHYLRAITIRRVQLGKNHAKTLDVEELYAQVLRKTQRISQAEEIEKRVKSERMRYGNEPGVKTRS